MAKPKSLSDELKEVADRESQLAGERRMRALRHANEMLKQERDRAYDQIDVLEKTLDLQAAMRLAAPPGPWQERKKKAKARLPWNCCGVTGMWMSLSRQKLRWA